MPAPDLDPAASIAFVDVDCARLRTATWGDGPASIVLLHDGLGSIGQWRDIPSAVHRSTGVPVMAYERAGHGASNPAPSGPWPADWLHREAAVLDALIEVLGIESPTLVGHSDGGSIALIQAATSGACRSAMVLAAHTWVEDVCVESTAATPPLPRVRATFSWAAGFLTVPAALAAPDDDRASFETATPSWYASCMLRTKSA